MNIAIVGFGNEGTASYDYCVRRGHDVTICDRDTKIPIPPGAKTRLGENYLSGLDDFDVIMRSAGIPPEVILERNPRVADKITSAINEFLAVCPTRNTIGVTGTKGKGTTSTLIAKMIEASGGRVFLGGNIGLNPLKFIDQIQPNDWVVLELSSFQLSDLKRSPHTAICLMVVPEHLDWHHSVDEYIASKNRLFENQQPNDIAIYFAEGQESRNIAGRSPGLKIPYYAQPGACVENGFVTIAGTDICSVDDLKLFGKHNWQNVCAAVTTVWQFTQNVSAIREVLTTFAGLEHRLEFVREVEGVNYYNDSFSTGLHATEAAIAAIGGPKIMIVGGYDRMIDIGHFADFMKLHDYQVKKILLIGASRNRVADTLDSGGYTKYVKSHASTMEEILLEAHASADPGDSVIFSPGFASFDMFKNFEQRGLIFKECVNKL